MKTLALLSLVLMLVVPLRPQTAMAQDEMTCEEYLEMYFQDMDDIAALINAAVPENVSQTYLALGDYREEYIYLFGNIPDCALGLHQTALQLISLNMDVLTVALVLVSSPNIQSEIDLERIAEEITKLGTQANEQVLEIEDDALDSLFN